MLWKRQEIFHEHAGKGSLLSSYEAETGLLWMWAGLWCFVSMETGMLGNFLNAARV